MKSQKVIACLLCRQRVNFSHKNENTYLNHLKIEHNVSFYLNFLLMINLMDKKSLRIVLLKFNETYKIEDNDNDDSRDNAEDLSFNSVENNLDDNIGKEVSANISDKSDYSAGIKSFEDEFDNPSNSVEHDQLINMEVNCKNINQEDKETSKVHEDDQKTINAFSPITKTEVIPKNKSEHFNNLLVHEDDQKTKNSTEVTRRNKSETLNNLNGDDDFDEIDDEDEFHDDDDDENDVDDDDENEDDDDDDNEDEDDDDEEGEGEDDDEEDILMEQEFYEQGEQEITNILSESNSEKSFHENKFGPSDGSGILEYTESQNNDEKIFLEQESLLKDSLNTTENIKAMLDHELQYQELQDDFINGPEVMNSHKSEPINSNILVKIEKNFTKSAYEVQTHDTALPNETPSINYNLQKNFDDTEDEETFAEMDQNVQYYEDKIESEDEIKSRNDKSQKSHDYTEEVKGQFAEMDQMEQYYKESRASADESKSIDNKIEKNFTKTAYEVQTQDTALPNVETQSINYNLQKSFDDTEDEETFAEMDQNVQYYENRMASADEIESINDKSQKSPDYTKEDKEQFTDMDQTEQYSEKKIATADDLDNLYESVQHQEMEAETIIRSLHNVGSNNEDDDVQYDHMEVVQEVVSDTVLLERNWITNPEELDIKPKIEEIENESNLCDNKSYSVQMEPIEKLDESKLNYSEEIDKKERERKEKIERMLKRISAIKTKQPQPQPQVAKQEPVQELLKFNEYLGNRNISIKMVGKNDIKESYSPPEEKQNIQNDKTKSKYLPRTSPQKPSDHSIASLKYFDSSNVLDPENLEISLSIEKEIEKGNLSVMKKISYKETFMKMKELLDNFMGEKTRCKICDRKMKNKSHLHEHIESKHCAYFIYFCESCDKQFKSTANRRSHVKKCAQ